VILSQKYYTLDAFMVIVSFTSFTGYTKTGGMCYTLKLAVMWRDRVQGGEGSKVGGARART
jgi:hypothetical protein